MLRTERQEYLAPRASPAPAKVVLAGAAEVQADDGVITCEPRRTFRGPQNRPLVIAKLLPRVFERALHAPKPQSASIEDLCPDLAHSLAWLKLRADSQGKAVPVHRLLLRKWLAGSLGFFQSPNYLPPLVFNEPAKPRVPAFELLIEPRRSPDVLCGEEAE